MDCIDSAAGSSSSHPSSQPPFNQPIFPYHTIADHQREKEIKKIKETMMCAPCEPNHPGTRTVVRTIWWQGSGLVVSAAFTLGLNAKICRRNGVRKRGQRDINPSTRVYWRPGYVSYVKKRKERKRKRGGKRKINWCGLCQQMGLKGLSAATNQIRPCRTHCCRGSFLLSM